VFLTVTILGFWKHGLGFLNIFWIGQAPLILRPVLALIEVISYFVRPISHSIRLAGNMMAGHAVIKVFATFGAALVTASIPTMIGIVVSPLAILAITAIYALEVLVSFIQAYVFAILTCVYLKDALHPHH
jgi:F-type H+-transporting ATPase subunit a